MALVRNELLDVSGDERDRLERTQRWDLARYWPSFLPAMIRIHSDEEVRALMERRRRQNQARIRVRSGITSIDPETWWRGALLSSAGSSEALGALDMMENCGLLPRQPRPALIFALNNLNVLNAFLGAGR